MYDLAGMVGRIGNDHAVACRAMYNLVSSEVDQNVAVLRLGALTGAQNVSGHRIAEISADIVSAGILAGAVSPLIGVNEMIEKTIAEKHVVDKPAAVGPAAVMEFLMALAVRVCVIL